MFSSFCIYLSIYFISFPHQLSPVHLHSPKPSTSPCAAQNTQTDLEEALSPLSILPSTPSHPIFAVISLFTLPVVLQAQEQHTQDSLQVKSAV